MGIRIPDRIGSDYDTFSVNRIPAGFTIYPTGQGDLHQASGYRLGDRLVFDGLTNTTKRFRMMSPWYVIGGRLVWGSGADFTDLMNAQLKAPATSHAVQQAGDFDKYSLGGGLNVFIPAAPGQGAWDLDLTATHTGTTVLKAVPVPVAGNTGWFDYDPWTQTLTVNASQQGGFNLYDFEATIFYFASSIPGVPVTGHEMMLDIPDVVGKLLYPQWEIEFSLVTTKELAISSAIVMIVAVKSNV